MIEPRVKVVYEGEQPPKAEAERLEAVLGRHFPPGFNAYARVDAAWRGACWRIRRVQAGIGTGVDVTRSVVAGVRAAGIPAEVEP